MSNYGESFCRFMQHLHELHGSSWFDLDLSMAQFKTLMLIGSSGGLTGRDLARRLDVGPSAVTPLVDRLVQYGYVQREEDPTDRRVTWTRLLPAGQVLFHGGKGSASSKDPSLIEITFSFEQCDDISNETIGAIEGIKKAGFDYLWVHMTDYVDPKKNVLVRYPDGVYVERVYKSTPFWPLGIGN